jgi:hypothetical protein
MRHSGPFERLALANYDDDPGTYLSYYGSRLTP